MTPYHIAVLPGDGIGPEVVAAGLEVLRAVETRLEGVRFTTEELPVGAAEYLRHGDPLPSAALERCRACDAILLGAMGLPDVRWPSGVEMTPQIDLRHRAHDRGKKTSRIPSRRFCQWRCSSTGSNTRRRSAAHG